VLPVPRFFSQCFGVGGHVAHARGVVCALVRAGSEVDVIAEEEDASVRGEGITLRICPLESRWRWRRIRWGRELVSKIAGLGQGKGWRMCYTRYSAGFSPWIPRLKSALGGTPLVIEVNSFASQRVVWARHWERRALRAADLIVCVSEAVRDALERLVDAGLGERILVLPNGVDFERFDAAAPLSRSGGDQEVRIGYAGTLKRDYGIEVLLRAFKRVRKARGEASLHVFGDGPHRRVLEVTAVGLDGCFFHGARPFEEMPGVLRGMDILVHTSSERNAFQSPIKVYEYMASGRPIVAARTPQVAALLGGPEAGLLYPMGDEEELAWQVLRLMDEPGLGERLARNAAREARTRHSWSARVQRLLDELKTRGLIDG